MKSIYQLISHPKRPKYIERMKEVPYTYTTGRLINVVLCTRLGICFVVGMIKRFKSTLDCSQAYYQVP